MDTSKALLIVDRPPLDARRISHEMRACGWVVHHVDDLHQVLALAKYTLPAVGLLYFSLENLPKTIDIENIIAGDHRKWIALIDQEPHENTILSRLLENLFFAYHVLPIEQQQLDFLLKHALSMVCLGARNTFDDTCNKKHHDHEIIGSSPTINKLYRIIDKVADVDASIYISGESGTGKELAARAIHERSTRAKNPFVAVNCGAIPSNLVQSELFGYEKGAFTGAGHRKMGRIEAAAEGTLFLDEIGDLPTEIQVNLLRFIEDKKVQRIGSLDEVSVNVRILCATHSNLENAVKNGNFREDLYHRLNVIRIDMPPLRERVDDIELLANYFFDKFLDRKSMTVRAFSHNALILLRQYHWPGNIRELINRIRRAMILCENRLIRPIDLGLERRHYFRHSLSLEKARNIAEHDVIQAALARNKSNIQLTAKDLGVSRVTLYRLIDKHGIHHRSCNKELIQPMSVAK
ncbi:sigma-54 dependent transcriptional regulator [Halomonas sp. M20]|uniref:sigma-54 dependent transcriptional regulator n=1 Tax=Halomonas sp. M20 TaxID=2763264 RepID=UPI001D0A5D44|nr:sigma-54 dependent transcriptional regulator [Halomonas sp. M20]